MACDGRCHVVAGDEAYGARLPCCEWNQLFDVYFCFDSLSWNPCAVAVTVQAQMLVRAGFMQIDPDAFDDVN